MINLFEKVKHHKEQNLPFVIYSKPNFINSLIYGYLRKSKAQRSFEYAKILLSKNIGTPQPFAFYENKTIFGLFV